MGYLKTPKNKATQKWPVEIIVDDREKKAWTFYDVKFKTKRKRLAIGDYSINGYEGVIAVEKKSGFAELMGNISGAKRKKFRIFLGRLSRVKHKYFVIEDSLENVDDAIKQNRQTRLTPESILYWLSVIEVEYGIPVLLVGKNVKLRKEMVHQLFSRIVEQHTKL